MLSSPSPVASSRSSSRLPISPLRTVRDAASPTGWKADVGPFPGWKDVPTWSAP
jgi:hypothetical protein